jgi:hypothetical protein
VEILVLPCRDGVIETLKVYDVTDRKDWDASEEPDVWSTVVPNPADRKPGVVIGELPPGGQELVPFSGFHTGREYAVSIGAFAEGGDGAHFTFDDLAVPGRAKTADWTGDERDFPKEAKRICRENDS